MEANRWLDGDVGGWFLRSLAYNVRHPVLSWATSGQRLRHGDLVCLRGDVGTGKSLIIVQTLAEFLAPRSAGGFGAQCLLILGNGGISPSFLKEQILGQLANDREGLKDSQTLDELLTESLKNLHVVSVQSVTELQTLVESLPALVRTSLQYCRIVFVDDLDLGLASASSFGPQMSHLSEVLHRFLQVAAALGLLMIYGLNRRAAPKMHATMSRVFTSFRMELEEGQQLTGPHPQSNLNKQKREREENYTEDASSPLSWCTFEAWRAPRRFVLHAFRHSTEYSRKFYSWEPSYFIYVLNGEKKALFAIKKDGHFELLKT